MTRWSVDFERKVRDAMLESSAEEERRMPIVVGVSGGGDSISLLHALLQLGYTCIVSHCNFQLRGDDAAQDANFVNEIARQWDCEVECIVFDTEVYAKQQQVSIEMAARALRYEWLEMIRRKHGAELIVVAHHKNDQAETVLHNLIRGSRIRGLCGMNERQGRIIRPLLDVSKKEIIRYLNENKLRWREDYTNRDERFTRNRIRHTILPELTRLNRSAVNHINRAAQYTKESRALLDSYIEKQRQKLIISTQEERLLLKDLIAMKTPRCFLQQWLGEKGFSGKSVDDIADVLLSLNSMKNSKLWLSETIEGRAFEFSYNRGNLILSPCEKNEQPEVSYLNVKILPYTNQQFKVGGKSTVQIADADSIKQPVRLRKIKDGDFFIPFGMHGVKKIGDFFTDKKVPIADRKKAMVVEDRDGKIIWLVSWRAAECCRVTDKTRSILWMEVSDNRKS